MGHETPYVLDLFNHPDLDLLDEGLRGPLRSGIPRKHVQSISRERPPSTGAHCPDPLTCHGNTRLFPRDRGPRTKGRSQGCGYLGTESESRIRSERVQGQSKQARTQGVDLRRGPTSPTERVCTQEVVHCHRTYLCKLLNLP